MKFGYLVFSYSNFARFEQRLSETGAYSINLGDYMQTLAVRSLYRRLGVADADTCPVDRDTLPGATGDAVILPMNAVFGEWCFPLPAHIVPIFIGFQATEPVVISQLPLLKQCEPIGCRDLATANLLQKHGVEAEVTGCLTMAFEPRQIEPFESRAFVIYGSGAGALPVTALRHAPSQFWDRVEFVSQRKIVHIHPLGAMEMAQAETHAAMLLEDYRKRATLAVTPLHHAATPCLASGIPVILCRNRYDPRFSFLQSLTPLYLPQQFSAIDWSPKLNDLESVRTRLVEMFKRRLDTALNAGRNPTAKNLLQPVVNKSEYF